MALTVEDGTGTVAAANSLVSIADAKAFATARNKPFVSADPAIEAFLLNAMDWLETKASKMKGLPLLTTQPLQTWPRVEVFINDPAVAIPATPLPKGLVNAQIQLAMEQDAGNDLMPTVKAGGFVTREVVGPVETDYSENIGTDGQPTFPKVEAMIAPYLNQDYGPLTVTRA